MLSMVKKPLPAMLSSWLAILLLAGGCTTRDDLNTVLKDILEALERDEERTTTTVDYDIGWETGTTIVSRERAEVSVEHYRLVEGEEPVAQAGINLYDDHGNLVAASGNAVAELQREEEIRYRSVIRESVPGVSVTPWRVWAYFTDARADIATLTINATEEFTDTTYTWDDEHIEIDLYGAFKYYIDLEAHDFQGPTTRYIVSECLTGDLSNIGDFGYDADSVMYQVYLVGIYHGLNNSDPFGDCGYRFYGVADVQAGEVFDQGPAGNKRIYYVSDETAETTIEVNGSEQTVDVIVVNYWYYDSPNAGSNGDLIDDCTSFWTELYTAEGTNSKFATTNETIMHMCPVRRVQGTQWWYENLLVRHTWTQQRLMLDERTLTVSDAGSLFGTVESDYDRGFGYEVITNCDHDNDGTNDGPCRFFSDDAADQNVAVGAAVVDFTDPVIENDLVRYLHYIQVDATYDYTVLALNTPTEVTAPADATGTTE